VKTDETRGDELSYLAESMIAQLKAQLGGNCACGIAQERKSILESLVHFMQM